MKNIIHISVATLFIAIFIVNIATLTIGKISYASLNSLLLINNASAEEGEPTLCDPESNLVVNVIIVMNDPILPDGRYLESILTKDCWDGGDVDECERGVGIKLTNIAGQTVFENNDFETVTEC